MDLLDFARGPLWWSAVAVLVLGSAWRVGSLLRLPSKADLSEPRSTRYTAGALRGIYCLMVSRPEFRARTAPNAIIAYVYHLGLAVIAFGYAPHIAFVDRLTGLAWPALPAPIVFTAVALTFVALVAALVNRLSDPVRRLMSTGDDYFSWFVVFLPLVTGMAALDLNYGPGVVPGHPLDAVPLAVHLMSVELLMIWLPFGKLSHVFFVFVARSMTGVQFERRGVRL